MSEAPSPVPDAVLSLCTGVCPLQRDFRDEQRLKRRQVPSAVLGGEQRIHV